MTNRWRRALAAPSGLFLLAVLAAGLAAPLLPLADPTAIDISSKFLPPSLEHPFGTDLLGRDMLSRMIWGIRTTFVTALLTMIVTAGVGMIAGGAAAAARVRAARMMRGLILHLNSAGFVQFARVTGASNMKVLFGHLVPNAAGECFVLGTIDTGSVVLMISALSFLGLGAQPPMPEWGSMLADAKNVMTLYPGQMFVPGLAILLVVAALNFLGDALRDAFDVRRTE
mgnify:CR=1 FL=1